ncbi:hypothetical protein ACFY97_02940 [Streptomyces klenkii]|uniref:hypothetical protein n=2 Tax=Streptomyces klenkii TaxID=1420899 RepID=UPI0036EDDD39
MTTTTSHGLLCQSDPTSVDWPLRLVVGGLQDEPSSPQQMLVLYSFAWTGLAIGFLPSRKLILKYGEEWRRGVRRESYEYPRRYVVAPVVTFIVMCFVASALST